MRVAGYRPGGSGRNGLTVAARDGYRRNGDPDWDPANLGPMKKGRGNGARVQQEARKARLAEFTRLREAEGKSVAQAATELGVARNTGNAYERDRLARKAGRS